MVEVSLAVAICAVGLVAILGLLPTGLMAARAAADRTMAANIANDAFSQLRIDPFGNAAIATDASYSGGFPVDLRTTSSNTYGYTQAGALPAGSEAIYFRVTLRYTSIANGLSRVNAIIVWPAAAASPANTNIFTTDVAWYDRL